MLKLKLFDFYVRGCGGFPFDMLRHDQCWPVGGEDAAKLEPYGDAHLGFRTIHMCGLIPPTKGRWASFLWPAAETDVWGSTSEQIKRAVEPRTYDEDELS